MDRQTVWWVILMIHELPRFIFFYVSDILWYRFTKLNYSA